MYLEFYENSGVHTKLCVRRSKVLFLSSLLALADRTKIGDQEILNSDVLRTSHFGVPTEFSTYNADHLASEITFATDVLV